MRAKSIGKWISVLGIFLSSTPALAERDVPFERTETREDCASYEELKQPFFGTTHVHTNLSFDASFRFVPPGPTEAFRFAKGEDFVRGVDQWGLPVRQYHQDRALDWAAVTDHSEHMGEMFICQSEGLRGRDSFDCKMLTGFYYQPTLKVESADPESSDCLPEILELTGECFVEEPSAGYPPTEKRKFATNSFTQLSIPGLGPATFNAHLPMCYSGEANCDAARLSVWSEVVDAAEKAYDRTSACSFTSFIAYENTSTPSGVNWHRNVIFRNNVVVDQPVTAIDMARIDNPDPAKIPPRVIAWPNQPGGTPGGESVYRYGRTYPDIYKFYDRLRDECDSAGPECDYLSIPHNSNLGGALQYRKGPLPNGVGIPALFYTPEGEEQARSRAENETLVEIFQDKGGSECRYDPRFGYGTGTKDELCDFEILNTTTVLTASGVSDSAGDGADLNLTPDDFDPKAYIRNVLKDGIKYLAESSSKVNPFKLGFVGGSDSHNGTVGWHPEDDSFKGHLGIEDAIPTASESTIQNNSGGHTVVWAEENSRDSIFAALKRKETYATSGTRPIVRFFGGWDFPDDVCDGPYNLPAVGTASGVPMGGDFDELKPSPEQLAQGPEFILEARKDDHIGTDLSRIQIIKGWVDESGETHEQVYHLAGDRETRNLRNGNLLTSSGATVVASLRRGGICKPKGGANHERLCKVFRDPDFDPDRPAFYYARVIENPVCRYSTHICINDYNLNPLSTSCQRNLDARGALARPGAAHCCSIMQSGDGSSPPVKPVIQERAWTSPIWYTPAQYLR